jgi:uncharacterized coiled-coil protein SlyX
MDSSERLTAIEMSIAHLQHNYDQLHAATLTLQSDLRQVQQTLQKLTGRLDQLVEGPEIRSPEEERPPHY